jgi:hypothetical protein
VRERVGQLMPTTSAGKRRERKAHQPSTDRHAA